MSDRPDPTPLADLDAVASALVEAALPVTVRQAIGPDEIAIAQRLRGSAIVDRGWSAPETLVDGRDADPDDDRAVHLLARRGDRVVGACRLLYPDGPLEPDPLRAVFLGRIVVIDPEDRARRAVAGALIGRSWLEIRDHGYAAIAGLTSAPMIRLLRRMGFDVRVVGPPVRNFGEERVPILFGPHDGSLRPRPPDRPPRRDTPAMPDDAGAVPETVHYPNGKVKYTGRLLGGEMHGAWAWYRTDGSVMRSGQFERGRQVGRWRTFDRSGKVVKETDFGGA